jgi:hypothetical protein
MINFFKNFLIILRIVTSAAECKISHPVKSNQMMMINGIDKKDEMCFNKLYLQNNLFFLYF